MSAPNSAVPDFNAMRRAAIEPSATSKPAPPASGTAEPSRLFVTSILLIALITALLSIAARWEPNKWLHGDGAFYMNIARGLLENQSLRQESLHPRTWFEADLGWNRDVDAAFSNIALGRNGEWWPKHPILMPLCAAPFIWAFGPIGSLVFQVLGFLLIALFAYRIAALFAPRPCALATALLFVTAPWVASFVWGFNNDMFFTALVLAAIDAALRRKAVACGICLGLAIFAKPTNALYAPALLLIFLMRRDFRPALKMCLAAAVPVLLFAALNAYLYGAPWKTGYDSILVRVGGKLATHSHRADFAFSLEGLRAGLDNVLFGKRHGFSSNFPLFFAALLGMVVMLVRRPRESIALCWILIVPIAFHAPFAWYRLDFSLPQMALSATPLAVLLSPRGKPFEEPFRQRQIRWVPLIALALAIALGLAGLIRRLAADESDVLWRDIASAQVFRGKIHCDYFNNQLERWECAGIKGDAEMTGRALRGLKFGEKREKLLLAAPWSDGSLKKIAFAQIELGNTFRLRYGLTDEASARASVELKMSIGSEEVLSQRIAKREFIEKEIDTSRWKGTRQDVTLWISSPKKTRASEAPFGIGGEIL